jgi:CubicO group peptidase (beta-lactamase class C family)
MDSKILTRRSWLAMTTPLRLTDGRSSGYGCGLAIRDRGPTLVLSHGGAVSGFTAWNMMMPATRSAAVVLANMDFAATGPITEAIMRALLPAPAIPDVASATPADAARALIEQFRRGDVDRAVLSPEFATYLTPARLADARVAIDALGPTGQIDLLDQWERGGLAVASLRIQLGQTAVQALLYRRPDGTVEEFLPYWP